MKRRAEVLDDHQPHSSSDSPHMYPNGYVVLLQHLQNSGYIIYTCDGEWSLDRGKEDDLHSAFVETIQFLMIKNHSGPMDVTLPAVYDNTLHIINQYVYSAVSPFRTYLQLHDYDIFINFVDNLTRDISTIFDEKIHHNFYVIWIRSPKRRHRILYKIFKTFLYSGSLMTAVRLQLKHGLMCI
jgi:hypothetical protein